MPCLLSAPDGKVIWVKVLATAATSKDFFCMSHGDLNFAEEQGENYHIFRVSGAGGPKPQLIRVVNPVKMWKAGKIAVCVLL